MSSRAGDQIALAVLAVMGALAGAASLGAASPQGAEQAGIDPPPFVTPLMIADYLNGARTFTAAEASQADFNHSGLIEVGDIVVRVNQFTGLRP